MNVTVDEPGDERPAGVPLWAEQVDDLFALMEAVSGKLDTMQLIVKYERRPNTNILMRREAVAGTVLAAGMAELVQNHAAQERVAIFLSGSNRIDLCRGDWVTFAERTPHWRGEVPF